jgi:two-component system C4-dicarboxylate transport response regulator DctD
MNRWHCTQVALVDDDADLRHALAQTLSLAGFDILPFSSGEAALAAVDTRFSGIVLSDIRMPGMDGLELQRRLHELDPELPVVLLTGHGDVAMAVRAIKHGAYHFITKPFLPDEVTAITKRALEERAMALELRSLRQSNAFSSALIGETPIMQALQRTIQQVAGLDMDIVIDGETGTGKGLVAKLLHATRARTAAPFVTIDCGALEEQSFHRDLFGAAPGHAGSLGQRWVGRFEQAHKGTLVLDAIDTLERALQQKLERAVETRTILPLGRNEPEAIDVRILATSQMPLAEKVSAGGFSGALYYRLNGISLSLPPLRDRRDDIPILFSHFLKRACDRVGREVPKLSPTVWRKLQSHAWPGNVRELQTYADQVALDLDGLARPTPGNESKADQQKDLKAMVADYECGLIEEALEAASGHVPTVLQRLNLPRKTFYDKVTRFKIDLGRFKAR